MNGLSFASSIITRLYWPVVVVVALVIFRRPLTELIGRVRRYEGLGQRLEFGDLLADAEDSVGKVAEASPSAGGLGEQASTEPSFLVRQAEANPSFVVIQAWEQLAGEIAELAGIILPGRRVGPWNAAQALPQLVQRELVSGDFAQAVSELRVLRNQVAHGQSNPTPGAAVAYAESAQVLTVIVWNMTAMLRSSAPAAEDRAEQP